MNSYRGRVAPTPTGHLHLGHVATFLTAWQRAREAEGRLILRLEDIDPARCRKDYAAAAIEDLRWLGLDWDEGPDIGGSFGPYQQSDRHDLFLRAWQRLANAGCVYPSNASRAEIRAAATAPHDVEEEILFPTALRPQRIGPIHATEPGGVNWRFCVPDGRVVWFEDRRLGKNQHVAGKKFGDFLVWRKDGWPSSELAVVADDIAMGITEIVRGEDLLLSTARQILLYEALGSVPPSFYHTPLVRDADGNRLAKRNDSLSIRSLRDQGWSPAKVQLESLRGLP